MRTMFMVARICGALMLVLGVIGVLVFGQRAGWDLPDWQLPEESGHTAWVDTDGLNLRAGPSTGDDILDVLPHGTAVEVTGEVESGFVPVLYQGTQAWVASDYLTDRAQPAPVPGFTVQEAHAAEPEPEAGGSDYTLPPQADPKPTEAPAPTVAPEPTGEHWIDVDRGTATVTLFIGDTPVKSFRAKIGWDTSADGFYSTAVGTYHVFSRSAGLVSTPFVDDVYMTHFVGFDPDRHNGFHSPIRDASGAILPSQNPTTLGCVRLDEAAAIEVFEFAYVGMRVEVHE
jgi:lipoprotein-anchoring transpeptidase ErfK/SrfK